MTSPSLSLILPIYNQSDHVVQIVESYQQALSAFALDYEIIAVVNGSNDTSLEICRAMSLRDERVKTLSSPKGWGRAVRLGIESSKGDLICYTNSARTSA